VPEPVELEELARRPVDEEDRRVELERDAGRVRVAAELEQQLGQQLQEAADNVENEEYRDQIDANVQEVQNGGVQNAGEGGPVGDEAVINMANQRIREQPDDRKQWNTQRFIAAFTGLNVISFLANIAYTEIKSATRGDPTTATLPEEYAEKIRTLVGKWWSQPDEDYWNQMAKAADNAELELTTPDQILFMNYTIDLSPPTPWIWEEAGFSTTTSRLRKAWATSGEKTSAMYREVTRIKSKNLQTGREELLPRPVAANVLRYALARIWINPSTPD